MKTLSCGVALALVGIMGAAAACGGGDGTGPHTAASVTGVTGDNQTGPTGAKLDFPLGLVLLGSNGQPVSGVVVSWSVPIGQATLSQSQDTSDASGTVGTGVTLGAQEGQLVVRATVPGVQGPVDYHFTVVNSCSYSPVAPVPGSVDGVLTTLDCNLGGQGYFYDFYDFTSSTQRGITMTMSSTAFDTYLELFTLSNGLLYFVAINNDSDKTTTNASLQTILAPGSPYLLGANTFNQFTTGPYRLTTSTRPQTLGSCTDEVWITRGVTISENIAATDCPDTVNSAVFYSDQAGIIAYAGSVLTVSEHSTAFNPFLTLFQVDSTGLTGVASASDTTAAGTDAVITYTVKTSAVFVVVPGTEAAGATGAYTLAVSPSLTASAPARSTVMQSSRLPGFLRHAHWPALSVQPRPAKL